MSDVDAAIEQLVTANRIVAHENVCDSYGHVSIRHPDNANRYLLAYSKSPSIVEAEDIVTFELDGTPVDLGDWTPYSNARSTVRSTNSAPTLIRWCITLVPGGAVHGVVHPAAADHPRRGPYR